MFKFQKSYLLPFIVAASIIGGLVVGVGLTRSHSVPGSYQIVPIPGGVAEVETTSGRLYLIAPEGVVYLGTPTTPVLKAIRRSGQEN